MAGINVKYMVTPSLQEVFVDKDTGLPIALGYLEFYKDNARNIPKHVYKLSGAAGAYTYTDLGIRVDLSAGGVPVDSSGNEIRIFYYPYETTNENNIELYYIKVFNALGVEQFDIQAHPNLAGSSTSLVDNVQNYIENGQFYITNNNMVPEEKVDISSYSGADIFWIAGPEGKNASGSWFFYKSNASATDDITQKRTTAIFESSPTYYLDLNCTVAGSGELSKGLFFAQQNCRFLEGETVTISILADSSSSSTINLIWEQNFGTGGSATVLTPIASQALTTTFSEYSFTFVIPTTSGKTIGTNNSDYWQLNIEVPKNSGYNLGITNVQLNQGNLIYAYNPESYSEIEDGFKSSMISYPFAAQGANAWAYMNQSLSLNVNNLTGIATFILRDNPPIGSFCDIGHHDFNYMGARGYVLSDGFFYPKALYRTFYGLYGQTEGRNGNTDAHVSGTTDVIITNTFFGATSDITDHDTGLTFSTLTPGGPSDQQVSKIAVGTATGATIKNGSYFLFHPRGDASNPANYIYACVFVKDNVIKFPPTFAGLTSYCPIYISSSNTPGQIATIIAEVFNNLTFCVPDWRGYFPRVLDDPYTGRDPNAFTRAARGDNVGGNVVGSIQAWQVQAHAHTYGNANNFGSGEANSYDATNISNSFTTGSTGGSQTNPINKAQFRFIKLI